MYPQGAGSKILKISKMSQGTSESELDIYGNSVLNVEDIDEDGSIPCDILG